MKVYDRIKTHIDKGEMPREAIARLRITFEFLDRMRLLTPEGSKVFKQGINAESQLTSDMVNEEAQSFLNRYFDEAMEIKLDKIGIALDKFYTEFKTGAQNRVQLELPNFLKQSGDSLTSTYEGQIWFYIPDKYFDNTKKNPVGQVIGQYVTSLGLFDWCLVAPNGKVGEPHPFCFPTVIRCKPDSIEKVNNLNLYGKGGRDYRILKFNKGDEVISDINVPQIIDNVEALFSNMFIVTNMMPDSIPYDKAHEIPEMAMMLNGTSFKLNMQMLGIVVSESYREKSNPQVPYRYAKTDSQLDYKQISVKEIPNYQSPYIALTSENFDESLIAAIINSDKPDSKIPNTPLERVVMQ